MQYNIIEAVTLDRFMFGIYSIFVAILTNPMETNISLSLNTF